jgi:hypothetical protein
MTGIKPLDRDGLRDDLRKLDKKGAIDFTIGAASTCCWEGEEDLKKAGVFSSENAKILSDCLAEYLGTTGGLTEANAQWLLVLLQNSQPIDMTNSARNWEGEGRAYAEQILTAAATGGMHPTEEALTNLVADLQERKRNHALVVRIDEVLRLIGVE